MNVRKLAEVNSSITLREAEVLRLISYGQSTNEIAASLYISSETVKSHRRSLFLKTGARNVAVLIRRAFEFGLITN